MLDLENKTPAELQALIAEAEQKLAEKQKSMRKEVIAQIKELAASIGASVNIKFNEQASRKSSDPQGKVAPKYQNPANPDETWTGRGVAPKWMQELIDSGRSKDEFLIEKDQ